MTIFLHKRFAHVCTSMFLVALFATSCGIEQGGASGQPSTINIPIVVSSPQTAPDGINIDADGSTKPIDQRLLGTNVPAWLSRSRFENQTFKGRTVASGTTVLRMPGGSWSNSYDWLACETGNQQQGSSECYWTWAARPTDFLNLSKATGQPAMWTVSLNGTAKEAAALVAFFNGNVNDTRSIGVDRNGKDWRTVGYWAKLRSDNGNPLPNKVMLWEVGNEIYGGKQGTGCTPYGWEDGWTCNGTEYAQGTNEHDGFLKFREEMQKVDSTILVGAVGVSKQSEWNNWGNDVIAAAGQAMDFYVIHQYAYGSSTSDYADVLRQPQATWKEIVTGVHQAFDSNANGRRVPIAITEYNLFAFQDLDNDRLMTQAVTALFLADTIGQMAEQGIAIANQYDLANGTANNGTDYGLLNADTYARSPQYYVFPLWSRFGSQMLSVTSAYDAATTLSVYAGRTDDGAITLLAINKTDKPITATVHINGVKSVLGGTADVVRASSLDATTVTFNGQKEPTDDLANAPATTLQQVANPLAYTFEPYSITLLTLRVS